MPLIVHETAAIRQGTPPDQTLAAQGIHIVRGQATRERAEQASFPDAITKGKGHASVFPTFTRPNSRATDEWLYCKALIVHDKGVQMW